MDLHLGNLVTTHKNPSRVGKVVHAFRDADRRQWAFVKWPNGQKAHYLSADLNRVA